MMTAKSRHADQAIAHLEKKPSDDWELRNPRADSASPLAQVLMTAIGDSTTFEDARRVNRIHTTEDFGTPSEFEFELGRQNVSDLQFADLLTPESPWDEEFFTSFEALLRETIAQ